MVPEVNRYTIEYEYEIRTVGEAAGVLITSLSMSVEIESTVFSRYYRVKYYQ